MATLNLGILAHVDAGKTSLTERLLYAAGVIDDVGRVDAGNTHTDSLALERARGITIKSAVVSFVLDDLTVNLIDTPGHPDFIAEVERVLGVLDGVVLVISAVEGVQPQTHVLMRTLRRLQIPTLIFVNKIDRGGARHEAVLAAIAERLTPAVVSMGSTTRLGTRDADFVPYGSTDSDFVGALLDLVAVRDDALLAAYVDDETTVSYERLRTALAAQTARTLVHPVYFGSAMTGAGVEALSDGIKGLLPTGSVDVDDSTSGRVFKIERGRAGERIAYVRMFSGAVSVRDRLATRGEREGKVTAIRVFDRGSAVRRASVVAGEIGQVWGLADVQIGDPIGRSPAAASDAQFAPPTLETVVVPRRDVDKGALHVALTELAEQDPLINVRHDDLRHEISLSLYGEVQKEVIEATLTADYGIEVAFRETSTICVERPKGSGDAVEILNADTNPFSATVGLRVEPGASGSGVVFRLRVEPRRMPLYVFKSTGNFEVMMKRYVERGLLEGLYGWRVTDCVVTMVDCNYSSADGPPSTRGPLSQPSDYRDLTPIVVMQALGQARTRVCEPLHRFRLELPQDAIGSALPALARLGAVPEAPVVRGSSSVVEGVIPAARVHRLQQRLPALTGGEGVLESAFDRYEPVRGPAPTRRRTRPNPLDRKDYLRHVQHRPANSL
ncbi:MAG TPA: translation factor GTPase family protein [Nocardioidaceae bacterium]|nr:translation factor GTPase family protein [Nocardioidaceae bacterium]